MCISQRYQWIKGAKASLDPSWNPKMFLDNKKKKRKNHHKSQRILYLYSDGFLSLSHYYGPETAKCNQNSFHGQFSCLI